MGGQAFEPAGGVCISVHRIGSHCNAAWSPDRSQFCSFGGEVGEAAKTWDVFVVVFSRKQIYDELRLPDRIDMRSMYGESKCVYRHDDGWRTTAPGLTARRSRRGQDRIGLEEVKF